MISFLVSVFEVVPSNMCVPCGGGSKTFFNCSTVANHTLLNGSVVVGVGGQSWRIHNPDGNLTTTLVSNMPDNLTAGYQFISPSMDEYTGIMVCNISSDWNGTTFQCIAFTPHNLTEQNTSAATVTLEVEGKCRMCVLPYFKASLQIADSNMVAKKYWHHYTLQVVRKI